jgi:hypothetical protein
MAKEKGFHEGELNVDQKLMLTVGEIAEAQEELRAGHAPTEVYYNEKYSTVPYPDDVSDIRYKPEGFGIELADALIRIADLAGAVNIDLQKMVEIKMAYNASRPHKHGRQF